MDDDAIKLTDDETATMRGERFTLQPTILTWILIGGTRARNVPGMISMLNGITTKWEIKLGIGFVIRAVIWKAEAFPMKSKNLETMKSIVVGASETLEYVSHIGKLTADEVQSCIIRMNELNDCYYVLCGWTMPDKVGIEPPILRKLKETEHDLAVRESLKGRELRKPPPLPDSEAVLRQSIGVNNRSRMDQASAFLEELSKDSRLSNAKRETCKSFAAALAAVYDAQTAAFYGKPVIYRELKNEH